MTGLEFGTTWVQIANRALGRIGVEAIATFDEATKQANHCRLLLGEALTASLAEYDWTFATKRKQLAALVASPAYGFSYYYSLPPDVERIIELDTGGSEYRREYDGIATDATEVYIKYVARIEDPTKMPEAFKVAVEARLAFLITPLLTSDEQLTARMGQEMTLTLQRAIANDAKSQYENSYAEQQGAVWFDELR